LDSIVNGFIVFKANVGLFVEWQSESEVHMFCNF